MFVGAGLVSTIADERAFKEEAERVIRTLAQEGGVILGRAAALVLADHPTALHVRLDAPEHVAAAGAQIVECDRRRAEQQRIDLVEIHPIAMKNIREWRSVVRRGGGRHFRPDRAKLLVVRVDP